MSTLRGATSDKSMLSKPIAAVTKMTPKEPTKNPFGASKPSTSASTSTASTSTVTNKERSATLSFKTNSSRAPSNLNANILRARSQTTSLKAEQLRKQKTGKHDADKQRNLLEELRRSLDPVELSKPSAVKAAVVTQMLHGDVLSEFKFKLSCSAGTKQESMDSVAVAGVKQNHSIRESKDELTASRLVIVSKAPYKKKVL